MEELVSITLKKEENFDNGFSGELQEEKVSGENATNGDKSSIPELVNGDGEEKRCAGENISNSVTGNNSNSDDYGDSKKEAINCPLDSNDRINGTTEVVDNSETLLHGDSPDTGGKEDQNREDYATGNNVSIEKIAVAGRTTNGDVSVAMIGPHSQLPKPEAPRGVTVLCYPGDLPATINRSHSTPAKTDSDYDFDFDMPAIGKFLRDKSNRLSAAITKRLSSSLKENKKDVDGENVVVQEKFNSHDVTEFNLSGVKVIAKLKNGENEAAERIYYRGRVSFFSRSNCRDCTAVRTYLRDMRLNCVEINIDVFPEREKELIERAGSASVPQIFFNEKLFGGLVAFNSLRNSGMLEQRLKDLMAKKCPADAPAPPSYGFDDDEEERIDEMIEIVRVLRQRLPIQDRFMKMKIVKNCFSGAEMVEVLIQHLDCGRKKAVEIGKQIARKHFIHHVFGENEFEDGNHYYRFLEHEPFIPKCFNFQGSTNDSEPNTIAFVSQRLTKIMIAILESYASDDRSCLDYVGISKSEEFRRYLKLTQGLQRVNVLPLSSEERLAFFINLYNAMVIHAVIRIGYPGGVNDRRSFNSNFLYIVGGQSYSLTAIINGILRNNRRAPYSVMKPFSAGDKRLELAFLKVNPLIHFGLCNGTRSSPPVRFFSPQGIESELKYAAREYFHGGGLDVDLVKRTIYLTDLFKWFSADFGQEKELLKWIINYLDSTKAGLLTHLLGDGGPINIVYKNYDWSVNS